jgi:hypothetical protein
MLVNVRISLRKYGEICQEKEISTGEFIAAVFQAFIDYG